MSVIYINAIQVEDCGNGLFAIHLPLRQVTEDERVTIARLFPNLSDKVYEVLEKEALIDSLADPAAIIQKDEPKKVKKAGKVSSVEPVASYSPPSVHPIALKLRRLPALTIECDVMHSDHELLTYPVNEHDITNRLSDVGVYDIPAGWVKIGTPDGGPITQANMLTEVTITKPGSTGFTECIQVLTVAKQPVK